MRRWELMARRKGTTQKQTKLGIARLSLRLPKKGAARRAKSASRWSADIGGRATARWATTTVRICTRCVPGPAHRHKVVSHLQAPQIPANAPPPPLPKRKRPAPPPPPHNPFARPAGYADPFSLLEERDYKHLVSDVLQVIEFLGANDWLKGVEIRPGQLDEESGIEVLEETEVDGGRVSRETKVEQEVAHEFEPEGEENSDTDLIITPVDEQDTSAGTAPAAPPTTLSPAQPPPSGYAATTVSILPAMSTASSALASLIAGYGSDTDDEEEVESVAAALTGRT